MARDHVADFVREHRGQFRRVIGERDQSARHVEAAARQRERVDRRGIEDDDAIAQVGPVGRSGQTLDDIADEALELRILINAAVGIEDAKFLAPLRRNEIGLAGRGDRRRLWRRHLAVARYRCRPSPQQAGERREGGDVAQTAELATDEAHAQRCTARPCHPHYPGVHAPAANFPRRGGV